MFGSMNDDDDESFFTPVSSSNLASLFGITMTPSNSSPTNTTLTYTAPKQPIAKTEEPSKSSPAKHQSSVLLFKEVHGFKVIEKQYATQGKCGLALIGNESVHVYQLLLYKQKNDVISTSKINPHFQFTIQKDNHATYCDDQRQNWTVRFNSPEDVSDFLKTLESKGAKIINITKNDEVSKTKGSDVPKVDISKNPVGADIESLKQIDSDNQSDSSSTNTKANILSRMAKMGQRILLPNTSISDGTDSETEKDRADNKVNRKNRRAGASPTVTSTYNATDISRHSSTVAPFTTASVPQANTQQYVLINGQYVPLVQPPHYMPIPTDIVPITKSVLPVETTTSPVLYNPTPQLTPDQLNMYFVENRTHNSEVRMNIVRLTNKIEEMYHKIQFDTANTAPVPSTDNTLKYENENLKSTINTLEKTIADMKTQYGSELNQKTKILEKESHLLEKNEEQNKTIKQLLDVKDEHLKKIEQLERDVQQAQVLKSQEIYSHPVISKEKFENIEEYIKKIMNGLYHDLNSQFSDEELIHGREVKTILAKKIVDTTYNIIAVVKELESAETDTTS